MNYYEITVYFNDGTKEQYGGDLRVHDGVLSIYTQYNGSVKIPLTSIKKYVVK